MRKTVLTLAAAVLLSIPALAAVPKKLVHKDKAPAPAITECMSPKALAAHLKESPRYSLTGDTLHDYIAAFNKAVDNSGGVGTQSFDEFDQLDIYDHESATYWVFVNKGCVQAGPQPATNIHNAIMKILEGEDL